MKFVVTGGGGFIGSSLVHLAVGQGHQVVTLDKLTYAVNPRTIKELNHLPDHQLVIGDIADRQLLAAVLAEQQPDVIFHLAAESHVDRSIDRPGDFIQTNLVGTFALLESSLAYWRTLPKMRQDVFRFIHVSTDEVYGSLGSSGKFSEDSAYAPNSPYAASKAGADHLARAWHKTFGLPVIITNCSNNYGPRQFPEKLIPLMIANGVAGKKLPVYGDGSNVRDWLFVEDHARALLMVADRALPGSHYMIGGGAEKTNLELVTRLCQLLDRYSPSSKSHAEQITFVADRPGHDLRYAADFSHISRELGWTPSFDLEEGLERTVRWYIDNQEWCDACGNQATLRQGR